MRSLPALIALCCAALTLTLCCAPLPVSGAVDPRLVVEYSEGRVEGVTEGVLPSQPAGGSGLAPVRVWRGLPFAQPPLGALRFRAPQPRTSNLTADGSTYDATSFKPPCIQPTSTGRLRGSSEDCLYLNVYSPLTAGPESKLPVYIYIHGGGFVGGSAIAFSATNFVVAGFDPNATSGSAGAAEIVVVTVPYRLGVFGFLALPELSLETGPGNIATSGNWGIMDQRAAMQWVSSRSAPGNMSQQSEQRAAASSSSVE